MATTDIQYKVVDEPSPRNNGNGGIVKLTLVIVVICLIVSTIAIILAATSFSKNSGSSTTVNVNGNGAAGPGSSSALAGDIWTFAIGHDGSNTEYIDDVSGTLRGFHVDIINAVCAQANKDCRLIWDIYQNCWDSQVGQRPRGGDGLMGKWYDACTGWFDTYQRELTFQFSKEFRKPVYGAFYVKPGNPDNFNPTNIGRSQKIAFGDGWSNDENCLARNAATITGVPLDPQQVVHYANYEQMLNAAITNEVAAVFTNTNQFTGGELDTVGSLITNCQRGGAGMMSRKDSSLNDWWNPAFDALKSTGTYREICARVDSAHGNQPGPGGDVICVD